MANLLDLFATSLSNTDQSFSFNAICSSIRSIASQSLNRLNSFIEGTSTGMNIVLPSVNGAGRVVVLNREDFDDLMDSNTGTITLNCFLSDGNTDPVTVSEDEIVDALSTSVTLNELLIELATAVSASSSIEDLSTKLTVVKSSYVAKGDQQAARIVDSLITFIIADSDQQSFKSAAMSWLLSLMGSTVKVNDTGEAVADFGKISDFSEYSDATPVVAWANSIDLFTSWPEFLEGLRKFTAPIVAAITAIGKGIITFGFKIHNKVKDLFVDPVAYGNNATNSYNVFTGRDDFLDSFILPFNMPHTAVTIPIGEVDPYTKLRKLVSNGALPDIAEYSSWNKICESFELNYIYNFDFPGAVVSIQRIHTNESIWVSDIVSTATISINYPDVKDYVRVAVRPKCLSHGIVYPEADSREYPISVSEFTSAAYKALSYGWNGTVPDRLQYVDDDHVVATGFDHAAAIYSHFALALLGSFKQGPNGENTDIINSKLIDNYILSSLPYKAYFESNWYPTCSHYDALEHITPDSDLNVFRTVFANPEDVSALPAPFVSAPGQFQFAPSYGGWIPNAQRAKDQGWADTEWNMEPLIAVLVSYIAKESSYFVPYTKQLTFPRGSYRIMTTQDQANMFSSFSKATLAAAAVVAGSIVAAKLVKSLKSKVLISGSMLQQFRMKFDGSAEQLVVLRRLNRTATFWNKVYGFVVGGVGLSAVSNAVTKMVNGHEEAVDANALIYNAITGTNY